MPDIGSPYSTTASTTLTFTDWWLKNPVDETYNQIIIVAGDNFTRQRKEEQSVYEPLGRIMPVVVRGVMRGERFKLKLEFLTVAAFNKFEDLRNQQATLLLQRGYTNEDWYGSLGAEREVTEDRADNTHKFVDIEFIETDAP